MLKSLSIRNVVLIDRLDLDLQKGFTVLSGETGAGKSILLDALGLLIGQRAETGMIRTGCDKLSVTGCFEPEYKNPELQNLCLEHELDFANEIIISRVLTKDGRSKIFFNDQPITLKLLKEIGGLLVEIHGQYDNQGLLNQNTHLNVLDAYGDYGEAITEMHTAFENYKKAREKRLEAEDNFEKMRTEEENLRHWVQEFCAVRPKANEPEELEQKRREMMNAEKLLENLSLAENALNGRGGSVRDALRQAMSAVARINGLTENRFGGIGELLDTALVNAEEAEAEIEKAVQEINLSQTEINEVEERLFLLKDLARKHHTEAENLPQVWHEMENKLESLENSSEDLQNLREAEQKKWEIYVNKAKVVHEERTAAAERLDAGVKKELPDLKMDKARFKTQISVKDEQSWNENGGDEVCFSVSTNPGTPFGPLNKIASGGELARFMLALKVNLGISSRIETMIFDEVDSGIGGATAQAVGDKLARLGEKMQIMVVTHSPQVASRGKYHYKVDKKIVEGNTITTVKELDEQGKKEEIARMLAGEIISDEARAAAKVLLGA